jgi:hypothetical protein
MCAYYDVNLCCVHICRCIMSMLRECLKLNMEYDMNGLLTINALNNSFTDGACIVAHVFSMIFFYLCCCCDPAQIILMLLCVKNI